MLQLRAEAAARGVFDLEVAAHELETSAAAIVQPLSPQVRSYLMCWLC